MIILIPVQIEAAGDDRLHVITFDHEGAGGSDLTAYGPARYATLGAEFTHAHSLERGSQRGMVASKATSFPPAISASKFADNRCAKPVREIYPGPLFRPL
ncbi:hypothetical protein FJW08_00920 [Mesorhizobium sp. B3-2-1]|uniref:hypothetical protein n=1 Tax=Mesorhizobium sp. B3-2-1 TaxID=2589891 RepID=UPI001129F036|nr:hypothetical protein [Mesorhizobium sp. B3-2-1]TPI35101.1 hypothetical protein FJW08_00920 [Mesorhizobium sp. B3-2-1]